MRPKLPGFEMANTPLYMAYIYFYSGDQRGGGNPKKPYPTLKIAKQGFKTVGFLGLFRVKFKNLQPFAVITYFY